jgi:putative ABC transport system ATP-binding protein
MIEAIGLHKTYSIGQTEVRALRGVGLKLERGSFAFVLGPSGSGKSTLLYLLGTLERPTEGKVLIDGADVSLMSEREISAFRRRKIGFVFQAFNLIANLSALENVLVPFIPEGVSAELADRARGLLARVGLSERLSHRPAQLSGGEQQRVAIARAVLKEPLLVLADEPTGELDTATGGEIFSIMRKMNAEFRTTFVVVTHDTRFVTPGDAVFNIRDGALVN